MVFGEDIELVEAGWMQRSDEWMVSVEGRFIHVCGGGTAGGAC